MQITSVGSINTAASIRSSERLHSTLQKKSTSHLNSESLAVELFSLSIVFCNLLDRAVG